MNSNSRSGQVIVEAIVALSVLVVGYLAILSLLNRSFGTSRLVAEQNIATYLAAEGLEVVHNLVDANLIKGLNYDQNFQVGSYEVVYNEVLDGEIAPTPPDSADPGSDGRNPGLRIGGWNEVSTRPLLYDPVLGYNYGIGTPTRFSRTVSIQPPDSSAGRMKVVSMVTWEIKGGGNGSIQLEDFFFTNN